MWRSQAKHWSGTCAYWPPICLTSAALPRSGWAISPCGLLLRTVSTRAWGAHPLNGLWPSSRRTTHGLRPSSLCSNILRSELQAH
eukprot:scaffold228764_cov29-Tisochrysis_lutea.AAC.4